MADKNKPVVRPFTIEDLKPSEEERREIRRLFLWEKMSQEADIKVAR